MGVVETLGFAIVRTGVAPTLRAVQFLGERAWYGMAVACYGVATAHAFLVWKQGFRRGAGWNYGILAVGFLFHAMALAGRGFSLKRCPVTNLFEAAMFVSWALCAAHLVAGAWPRARMAGLLLAPLLFATGIFALQPALDRPGPVFEIDLERAAVSLHVSLILLAYAGFGFGALAGVLILVRRHGASEDTPLVRNLAELLPSGQQLEGLLLRSLGTGLVLLTAGLVLSLGLMRERYGVLVRPDPKIAWSFFVWAVYLGMMMLRLWFRQGNHRLAWGALAGFAFVLLTFWGTNLMSPIHHP